MAARQKTSARKNMDSRHRESGSFRRKEGRVQTKKITRKVRLRFKHIVVCFFLLTGLFFGLQQLYLFAITWEKLDIEKISISCDDPEIETSVLREMENRSFGNILLLNIDELREEIKTHPRIKEVHVRKIFPLSLNIHIEERRPFAVLQKEEPFLIDRDGFIFGNIKHDGENFPLLVDENLFKEYYLEKIQLASECFESLSDTDRKRIEIINLTESMNIKLKFRDHKTWLVLGNDHFAERIQRYLTEKQNLENHGVLEYVDLRFQDRFFIKPLKEYPQKDTPTSLKEEN